MVSERHVGSTNGDDQPDTLGHVRPVAGSSAIHCWNCRYDLRGLDAQRCPECGKPAIIPLSFQDQAQFTLSRAALEEAELVEWIREPVGGLGVWGQMHGIRAVEGVIAIPAAERARAAEVLRDAGVWTSVDALPIVDRSEPNCPACSQNVDPSGPGRCSSCGAQFDWVDVGHEPDESPAREGARSNHDRRRGSFSRAIYLVAGYCFGFAALGIAVMAMVGLVHPVEQTLPAEVVVGPVLLGAISVTCFMGARRTNRQ